MGRTKRELMSSAPWRGEEEAAEEFRDAKLKVTKQAPEPVMHVPRRKNDKSKRHNLEDDDSIVEIDPQLCYSFRLSSRVFSIDTIVKPLPLAMAYNISCNLSFFTRIFTQFFDLEGIEKAHKSLGIGQEEKARRVR